MSTRDYPRLPIEQFGEQLLLTNDLDPIYVALWKMQLPPERLKAWLVAYWCWYSAGVACWMSEQGTVDRFWSAMRTAAANTDPAPHGGRWERGKERRHARGKQGTKMVEDLLFKYPRPGTMVDWLTQLDLSESETILNASPEKHLDHLPYCVLQKRVMSHVLFGPWISYKVGDMIERLSLAPVVFQEEDAMYEEPTKGAILAYDSWAAEPGRILNADVKTPEFKVRHTLDRLSRHFEQFTAPPRMERPIGLQEIETILCKWKSHMGGHYPLGNDITEIRHGLKPWLSQSKTARQFLECMP